jgi:hypothetical protein
MTNQLAIREDMSLGDVATHFVKSGYFQDVGDVSKAIVKIMAGREFGFGPFASMTNIYIIQGRPSLGANLLASAVKRNDHYDYRIRQMDDTVCKIEYFQRAGDKWESLGISAFTLEDARKAGTKNLEKFPRNMLFARAMSNGVRWYCPDVFGSAVYTPEELGAEVDEAGDVIEGSFAPAAPIQTVQTGEAKPIAPSAPKANMGAFNAVQFLIENQISENSFAALAILNSKITPNEIKTSPDKLLAFGKLYRAWKDSGVTTDQALEYARDNVSFE